VPVGSKIILGLAEAPSNILIITSIVELLPKSSDISLDAFLESFK
jgi:hypothetical protein